LQSRLEREFFAYGIFLTTPQKPEKEMYILRWETDGGVILKKEAANATSFFIIHDSIENIAA